MRGGEWGRVQFSCNGREVGYLDACQLHIQIHPATGCNEDGETKPYNPNPRRGTCCPAAAIVPLQIEKGSALHLPPPLPQDNLMSSLDPSLGVAGMTMQQQPAVTSAEASPHLPPFLPYPPEPVGTMLTSPSPSSPPSGSLRSPNPPSPPARDAPLGYADSGDLVGAAAGREGCKV